MKKEVLMRNVMKNRWKKNEFREMMVQKATDRWKKPMKLF